MSSAIYDIRLNDSGDIYLNVDENGYADIELISGPEQVLQSVRIALSILKNEYAFRPEYGLPLVESNADNGSFLLSRLSDEVKRNILQEVIMSVEGVSSIENISFDIDNKTRSLKVTLDIKTNYDEIIHLEHVEGN